MKDVVPQQGLQGFAVHYIGGIAEKFSYVKLEPGVLKKSHGSLPVQIHQYVDVVVVTSIAARDGTEDGGMPYAQCPQFSLMLAQGLEKAVK